MCASRTLNDANLAKDGEIFHIWVPAAADRKPDKKAPETKDAPATSQQSGTIL
jgi:hypothetical protein